MRLPSVPLPHCLDPSSIAPRRVVAIAGAAALLASLTIALTYGAERSRLQAALLVTDSITAPPRIRLKFYADGVRTPTAIPAAEAPLKPDDEVIGVEVAGHARAYRLGAMLGRSDHIVNDLVAGEGVSVTYCDLSGCVRGFGAPGGEPLDLAQAGLYRNQMTLKVAGVVYVQGSGQVIDADPGHDAVPFPYAEVPLTRTTWEAWRSRRPDTDVYVGGGAARAEPASE